MKTKRVLFISCLAAGAVIASPSFGKPAKKSAGMSQSKATRVASHSSRGMHHNQNVSPRMGGTRYYSGARYTGTPSYAARQYSGTRYNGGTRNYGNYYGVGTGYYNPIKTGAALVEEKRRSKVRVARINGRAAWQQLMCEGRTAIVL